MSTLPLLTFATVEARAESDASAGLLTLAVMVFIVIIGAALIWSMRRQMKRANGLMTSQEATADKNTDAPSDS